MFSEISWIVTNIFWFICVQSFVMLFRLSFWFTADQHWLSKLMIFLLVSVMCWLSLIVLLRITFKFRLTLFEWEVVRNQRNVTHWLTNRSLLCLSFWTWITFHTFLVRWWIVITYICCIWNWFSWHHFLLGLWINLVFHLIVFLLCVTLIHLSLDSHWVAFLSVDWRVFTPSCCCSTYWINLSHLYHWSFNLKRLLSCRDVILWVCSHLLLINTLGGIMFSIDCNIWLVCMQNRLSCASICDNICVSCLKCSLSDNWVMISSHCFVLVCMKSAKLPIRTCLSSWEKHWVKIVNMHLLKLRKVHLIWSSC